MALAQTSQSIGAVTRLVADHLNRRTSLPITVGHPEDSASAQTRTLNLFLYEVVFDPGLKNHPLAEGRTPPLWLVLKYLLTGFDDSGHSDSAVAHEVLGHGLSALQELAFLGLDQAVASTVRRALEDNPETLKLTFDECTVDLINKLTQASDDDYRLSAAFQIRPVMIVPPEQPALSPLVGINSTTTPIALATAPVGLDVLASLGPQLTAVVPEKFAIGDEFTLTGHGLQGANLECFLGPVELGITRQTSEGLTVRVEAALQSGTLIAAGEHPLFVRQVLPATGHARVSNTLLARLLPTVTTATSGPFTADPEGFLSGSITLQGFLLGRHEDAILVALYRDGAVAHLFEIAKPEPLPGDPPDSQQELVLALTASGRVRAGAYQLIVLVNGQQARQSLSLVLAP